VDVLHVALEDESDDAPQDGAYAGPVFSELDEAVQDAFEAYLEQRGVDSALAEYLVELSIDKEQREYVNWLKRTAAFVAPK
jgi:complement component 1 Q subcomponent-binding protein